MEKTRQYRLKVSGMHCVGCLHTVEAALKQVPGTEQVRVDYLRKEATVVREAPPEAWLQALKAVGYPAQVLREEDL